MTILIIGSEGFIGRKIVDFFSQEHTCVCADIIDKTDDSALYFRIDSLNPEFDFLFIEQNIDVCINASGSANVSLSIEYPVDDFIKNCLNVDKILDSIRRLSPNTRFINFSSAAVYGNPVSLPIHEDSLCKPVSPYGYDKYCSEKISEMYSVIYGIKTYSLRVFSVYGKGQQKLLIWDIVNKFMYDDAVRLFGTGGETRDYICIDDLVNVINIFVSQKNIACGIYNVANGTQISVKKIADLVKHYLNSEKTIVFTNKSRAGDPLNWEADIEKIKKLGYTQTVQFEDGLHGYVRWAVKYLKG